MRQIAYFSTAAEPQTSELMHEVLVTSRAHNQAHEITGLLVAGGNRYMQVFEGPKDAVEQLYSNIRKDRRHLAISTIADRRIFRRSFDGWSMAFRREPALGEFDRFPDVVRFLTERIDDDVLRNEVRRFSAVFIAGPPNDVAAPWPLAS